MRLGGAQLNQAIGQPESLRRLGILRVGVTAAVFSRTYSSSCPVDDGSNLTTYTSAALDVGAASADRIVIAIPSLATTGPESYSSVTIGGNAATNITRTANAGTRHIGAWFYQLTTGTTAVVETTMTGAANRCGLDVIAIRNTTQTTYHARAATLIPQATTVNSDTAVVDVPTGGFAIAMCRVSNSAATAIAWSHNGAGSGTTHSDRVVEAGAAPRVSVYSYQNTTGGTETVTFTANGDDGEVYHTGAFSWGP